MSEREVGAGVVVPMPGREAAGGLSEFQVAPFDVVEDVCGDPVNAALRVLFAGNQYMALPDLMNGFLAGDGQVGPVFYETLPPGVVVDQLRRGGLRMGALELRFTPDVIAVSPGALDELAQQGFVGSARVYARNVLAVLVRSGNPAGVSGLADLARAGVRLSLPNPETESIGRLAVQMLAAAGGDALRDRVADIKRRSGETVLTRIHHRQSPAWLAEGSVDAAIVWETEARHLIQAGAPVEQVAIDPGVNQQGTYAAAIVNGAPHPEAAGRFLRFLTGPAGKGIYARHGFDIAV